MRQGFQKVQKIKPPGDFLPLRGLLYLGRNPISKALNVPARPSLVVRRQKGVT